MTLTPRLHAVTLLLRSFHDFDFQPETWSGQLVRRQARAGEGPSRRARCEACKGEGKLRKRGIEVPCDACGARGWLVVDAYTERKVGSADTEAVVRRWSVLCDGCGGQGAHGNGRRCVRCDGAGRLSLSAPPARPFREGLALVSPVSLLAGLDKVLAAADRRDRAGSYAELGAAMSELSAADRGCYRLVLRAYVLGQEEHERKPGTSWGLGFLEVRMPEPIRVPAGVRAAERRRETLRDRGKVA